MRNMYEMIFSRLRQNQQEFGLRFPTIGEGRQYRLQDNDTWLASFWTGLQWLAYAAAGDQAFRDYAASLLPSFEDRLARRVHLTHDLGFLFTLSARAQWQLTGDLAAHRLALQAADELAARFRPIGGYIQAWGPVGDPEEGGRMIIDTMMNIPLLFWASDQTGDPRYADIARQHATTSARWLVREDASSNHTFFFDQSSGAPLGPRTHQGYSDESLWARGQGWTIYGFATAAQWCDETSFADLACRAADRFMAELPASGIPTWDLRLPADAPQYPDTSAGAIAAAGMLRLARYLESETALKVCGAADRLLDVMVEHCLETEGQGLLRGGTYHAHKNWGVDSYFICGDYFFLEALLLRDGRCPDLWGPAHQS